VLGKGLAVSRIATKPRNPVNETESEARLLGIEDSRVSSGNDVVELIRYVDTMKSIVRNESVGAAFINSCRRHTWDLVEKGSLHGL
jgi:hypothetical protein